MNAFRTIVIALAVMAMVILACGQSYDPNRVAMNLTQTAEPTQLPLFGQPMTNTPAPAPIATTGMSTQAPANTQAPTATIDPPSATSWNWVDFRTWLAAGGYTDPYILIKYLDANSLKIDHPAGGWVNDSDSIVWTTAEATQTGMTKMLTDGLTGLWFAPKGTLVLSPGGQIRISNFDGGGIPSIDAVLDNTVNKVTAASCVNSTVVADAFAKATSPENLISRLDDITDNNPSARLISATPGYVENVKANTALFWTSGAATNATVIARTASGKIVYAALGGKVEIDHAFNGVNICQALTGDQMALSASVKATMSCVPSFEAVNVITDNRGVLATRENTLYPALQALADAYPNAVTTGHAGDLVVKWLTSLLMVNDGAHGSVIALDTQKHHSLWLATQDGTTHVGADYTLFPLCSDLNPERDFEWWGKQ